ncbi:unnamed protein product [Heligmosomoides polygyrus]|uniref:C2H2-type domain-containing protein n=1 Tax=Heligmosomoides polygyrus TaxID=6339 RepID=A0A183G9R1_HELPZ|nr:unnamed protein product [Heligmosomoides polygyrus]
MLRKQRATPSPMVLPADRSKAQAEHSEPPSVQPQEPGADVDPVVPPQELVEPDAVLMDDEEADKLLELGAEAISMPTPRSARTASARGRGRGRGKKGAAARSSRDLAAPVSSANPEQIRKQYEEALASKLRRRDTTAEERPSTSAEVKHMSIHGKKMMSIREQQEAQMKVSIKDKVAMMKKKEEAERIRTLEDSGEGGGADEEVEPSDVQPPAEQPTQEASAQEGNEDGSMDVESRPVDSTPKISQDGSSVSLELLEDLAMEGEVPFGCTGMEEVHFDKQVEDVAQSPESEPETEQEKEPEPLPEQEKEPEPEPEQEKEPEPLPEQENEPEPEPVSDLDIRHEEEVAVDQPAEEQLSAEDDQQMDDTPAVDMVEKIPSAENTDAVVDESALLPALVESSEAALASVDDMGETAGLQIDDGLPEEEAAVESGPGKEVVEEADAAPTAPTAMEIGNDEQAPELREEVPASASKEPELSGPVEEQCPVQEGAGEQAAEVVVSESSEPCSSSPIAKPKLAEDTKRALGFGRRLRVDLGDKLEPISGTPSPQGAEKRKSVDEGERISTDAQSSEGQEAMPSADVRGELTSSAFQAIIRLALLGFQWAKKKHRRKGLL